MSEEKSLVPMFSGKRRDYQLWAFSFLAHAKSKDYEEYLLGEKPLPTGTADSNGVVTFSKDEDKVVSVIRKAWADLVYCIDKKNPDGEEALMDILEYGEGKVPDITKAWAALRRNYGLKNLDGKHNLLSTYLHESIETGENPKRFIQRLKVMRRDLLEQEYEIEEEDFKFKIFEGVPYSDYGPAIEALRASNATVQEISSRLETRFHAIMRSKPRGRRDDEAFVGVSAHENEAGGADGQAQVGIDNSNEGNAPTANRPNFMRRWPDASNLTVNNGGQAGQIQVQGHQQQQVICYTCGQPGHKSYQCPTRQGYGYNQQRFAQDGRTVHPRAGFGHQLGGFQVDGSISPEASMGYVSSVARPDIEHNNVLSSSKQGSFRHNRLRVTMFSNMGHLTQAQLTRQGSSCSSSRFLKVFRCNNK